MMTISSDEEDEPTINDEQKKINRKTDEDEEVDSDFEFGGLLVSVHSVDLFRFTTMRFFRLKYRELESSLFHVFRKDLTI